MQIELKSPQEKAEETYAIGDVLLVSHNEEEKVVGLFNYDNSLTIFTMGCDWWTDRTIKFTNRDALTLKEVSYVLGKAEIIRKLNVKLVEV